jgi:sarcosine oxidase subunit beta
MASVEEEMSVKTRALHHEVHFVPSPVGFDFEKDGCFSSDGDSAIYFRPEVGNTILVGSEDPDCDKQE